MYEAVPSRELTNPTWGKGKSSTQKCRLVGDMWSFPGGYSHGRKQATLLIITSHLVTNFLLHIRSWCQLRLWDKSQLTCWVQSKKNINFSYYCSYLVGILGFSSPQIKFNYSAKSTILHNNKNNMFFFAIFYKCSTQLFTQQMNFKWNCHRWNPISNPIPAQTPKLNWPGFQNPRGFDLMIFGVILASFLNNILREPQHTPGAYPRHPLSPPNERNSKP